MNRDEISISSRTTSPTISTDNVRLCVKPKISTELIGGGNSAIGMARLVLRLAPIMVLRRKLD